MGLVLAFQTASRPASRHAPKRRDPAQTADIVFFTGVRYERHVEGVPAPVSHAERNHSRTPPVS